MLKDSEPSLKMHRWWFLMILPIEVVVVQGGYVVLKRIWKKGDKIVVTLPMQTTIEQLPDGSDYVAVLHGPIVLAAKTDTTNLKGLFADDSRMGHVANGEQYPLQDMPVFTLQNLHNIIPVTSDIVVKKTVSYNVPAYSFSVIRIKQKSN